MSSIAQIQSTIAALSPAAVGTAVGTGTASASADAATGAAQLAASKTFDGLVAGYGADPTTGLATATPSVDAATATSDGVTGADVVADAKKYLGVPYVLGGESRSGMDCSGLVQRVFRDLGVTTTRLVHTQKLEGTKVDSLASAKPGDLIVFKGGDHIAIYAGNGQVIHAPYPGRTVSLQKLWTDDSGIETIRRIVPAQSGSASAAAAGVVASGAVASGALSSGALAAGSSPSLDAALARLLAQQSALMAGSSS
nr:C40 family peptidase [Galbitalea soli]